MPLSYEIWRSLAGIAIFLLGMMFLEESLQQLVGRPFKLFLKKQTSSKPKAILGGTLIAGLLQSSSVVNLMVLAFVGANVIQMQHALAIILGANLGTTFGSWIIALVGFQFNIENFAYPVVALSGILMVMSNRESIWFHWSKFLFGFGFLFIGLGYIRTGIEGAVKNVDLSSLNDYHAVIFLLAGFLITSLIQSSTATVAIVLSALHVNAIGLYDATAIVLGSEVGTTIKLVLASLNGVPAKKRVALGNLLYNVIVAVVVFVFLMPINRFIKEVVMINDDLYALVFFQSLVNVIGIILFYPFLGRFGKYLQEKFTNSDSETLYIHKVKVQDFELAIVALENEVRHFILHTISFTREVFELSGHEALQSQLQKNSHEKNIMGHYDFLKHLHGETHRFAIRLQNFSSNNDPEMHRLVQLISASRNTMYAAKSIKDALPDINQLRNSSNDMKYGFFRQSAGKMDGFCNNMTGLLLYPVPENAFKALTELYTDVTHSYTVMLQQLYKENLHNVLSEIEISTLINFNREMYTAYKSYLFALKDYLLDEKQAAFFDEQPGFIR